MSETTSEYGLPWSVYEYDVPTPEMAKATHAELVDGNVSSGDFTPKMYALCNTDGNCAAMIGCGPNGAKYAKFILDRVNAPAPPPTDRERDEREQYVQRIVELLECEWISSKLSIDDEPVRELYMLASFLKPQHQSESDPFLDALNATQHPPAASEGDGNQEHP